MFANKTFSFVKHFKLFLIISAILVVTGDGAYRYE